MAWPTSNQSKAKYSITNGKEAGITNEIANTISYNVANSIAIRIDNGKVSGIINYIANNITNEYPIVLSMT
jgi:hypothetical protein